MSLAVALLAACSPASPASNSAPAATGASLAAPSTTAPPAELHASWAFRHPLPRMPPALDGDVYAATESGRLSPSVRRDPGFVYVPDSSPGGTTVTVISQRTVKGVGSPRARAPSPPPLSAL